MNPRRLFPALALTFLATAPTALRAGEAPMPDKGAEVPGPAPEAGWPDVCKWLDSDPGLLFDEPDHPFLNRVKIGGRLHYQAAYVDGKDVNGRSFHDTYDELRRLRLETEFEFFRFLTLEANLNLVDDRRYRDSYPTDLDWTDNTWDTLTLEFDIDKAFDLKAIDKVELTYGKMKLKMGEEAHQSSREILTIERSAFSEALGSDEGRPTGLVLSLGQGDWDLDLGVFSGEDNGNAPGGWNDGHFYYGSLGWKPTKKLRFVYDQVLNAPDGRSFALGYGWAGVLSGVYDDDRWGLLVSGGYGDRGGFDEGNLRARRQGDFWGGVVMPWYWVVEDRLQLVLSYTYQASEEEEGIRLDNRYIRARHDDPLVDVGNGRGDRSRSLYAGLNYYLCDHNAKIMGGVSYTKLDARQGDVRALSYMIALRSYF